jgi:hypothetical protein
MHPQLTETWAAAYLQCVIMLFVFSLGFPALMFHFAVSDDLVCIIHRNGWIKWNKIILFASPYAIFSGLLIWILHPYPSAIVPYYLEYGAAFGITILISISPIPWLFVIPISTRHGVIKKLKKEILKSLNSQHFISETLLEDLSYIGENSAPGREKEMVLQLVNEIGILIQKDKEYTGSSLKDIIKTIENILAKGSIVGNDENYIYATGILENMLFTIKKYGFYNSSDEINIIKSFRLLNVIAMEKLSNATVLTMLQLSNKSAENLFEIGKKAIDANNYNIALLSFKKLELLVINSRNEQNRLLIFYFGLLSHIWNTEIIEIKSIAEESLLKSLEIVKPNIYEIVEYSIDYFLINAQYDTIYKLNKMKDGYNLFNNDYL